MNILTLDLSKNTKKYLSIYKQIKKMILEGSLKSEEKLPSKRALAANLGVSLNTIMYSYDLLLKEGYIYSKERSGFYVSSYFHQNKNLDSHSYISKKEEKKYLYDFTSSSVDSSVFPSYTFKKIVDKILVNNSNIFLTKSSSQGDDELREAISKYLLENKGINVSIDNIIIVSSLEESFEIINKLISIENFLIEDPGYHQVLKYLDNKVNISYAPLDKEGISLSSKPYDLVYVTPYNQFPSGIKMSLKRKNLLVNSKVKYIFEDDFDCDLINKTQYVSTIYSLNNYKVFYHGSFSHSLCPGLRISYLVIPKNLEDKYLTLYKNKSSRISSLDQKIIATFLNEGYYYRHINKLKKVSLEKKLVIKDYFSTLSNSFYQIEENELSFFISLKKDYSLPSLKKYLEDKQIKINFICDFSSLKNDKRIILNFYSISKDKIEESLKYLTSTLDNYFKI